MVQNLQMSHCHKKELICSNSPGLLRMIPFLTTNPTDLLEHLIVFIKNAKAKNISQYNSEIHRRRKACNEDVLIILMRSLQSGFLFLQYRLFARSVLTSFT